MFLMLFNIFKNNFKLVPKKIQNQQKVDFPAAFNIDWTKSENFFEAVFYIDDTEHIAKYSLKGLLTEYKKNLWPDHLPENIASECIKHGEVMNSIEIFRNDTRIFEIIVRKNDFSRYFLIFNSEGLILEKKLIET